MRQRNQNSQKLYRNERNYEAIITQNDLKLYRNVRNCEWTDSKPPKSCRMSAKSGPDNPKNRCKENRIQA